MQKFVKFTEVYNFTRSVIIRHTLERAGIPNFVKNENLHHLFGMGVFNAVSGAIEIFVPENMLEQAKSALEKSFEIEDFHPLVECPACGEKIEENDLVCKNCGLFLK